MDRAEAVALDDVDPLSSFRDRFVITDEAINYCLGNSLGRLPRATAERVRHILDDEWGGQLIRGWDHWADRPLDVGDLIGTHVVGAAPGQVAVADSTTVNLHRLAAAALAHAGPDRPVIITDRGNFPTDRYVFEGLGPVRWVDHPNDLADALVGSLAHDVGLVSFSWVDYRSSEIADVSAITEAAHGAGALMLWDLSHAAGIVPVGLDAIGADLAVGCTYKYLNAGPGAPAFQYVRADLIDELPVATPGWFGQNDQFAMGPTYQPRPGVGRFLAGTPNIVGVEAVRVGVEMLADAGIDDIRTKSQALTGMAIRLFGEWLEPLGCELMTPLLPHRRGGHIALLHPDATAISAALAADHGVLTDVRQPGIIRLSFAPLYTRYGDVWDAIDGVREVLTRSQ